MTRRDVVEYLRENLPKFSVDALRRQLLDEGVSEEEFDESLGEALRDPKTVKLPPRGPQASPAKKALLFGGVVALAVAAVTALMSGPAARPGSRGAEGAAGESAYVGAHGWVLRLPKDYAAYTEFKGPGKSVEIVHFAKRGTDPTSFLDEGLYGPMGIVRLTVAPSEFPANPTGAASLSAAVARKTGSHGEKFEIKDLQIANLSGVQVNVQSPFPRVEAYILGRGDLFFFYAGQEDDVWRDIVQSLRDMRSEN